MCHFFVGRPGLSTQAISVPPSPSTGLIQHGGTVIANISNTPSHVTGVPGSHGPVNTQQAVTPSIQKPAVHFTFTDHSANAGNQRLGIQTSVQNTNLINAPNSNLVAAPNTGVNNGQFSGHQRAGLQTSVHSETNVDVTQAALNTLNNALNKGLNSASNRPQSSGQTIASVNQNLHRTQVSQQQGVLLPGQSVAQSAAASMTEGQTRAVGGSITGATGSQITGGSSVVSEDLDSGKPQRACKGKRYKEMVAESGLKSIKRERKVCTSITIS